MFSCMDKVDGDIFFMVGTHMVCVIDIYLFVLFQNQQFTIVDALFVISNCYILLKHGSQMAKGKGKTTAFEKLKGLIISVYTTI